MDYSFTAPMVPSGGADLFPDGAESFAAGLWQMFRQAASYLAPSFSQAAGVCLGLLCIALLLSVLESGQGSAALTLAGTVAASVLLLTPTGTMAELAYETVEEICAYGKLLLPVMSAAMAAQGAVGTSAALYAGTAMLNSFLTSLLSGLLIPGIYTYLAVSSASAATDIRQLKACGEAIRNAASWLLKTVLYVFTGYMGITGVVSGSVDAAALKAAKLTISGVVPVVGGILSDATESVLAGFGVMKSAAGVYGMLAILAISLRPFLRIGAQYVLLKATAFLSGIFTDSAVTTLLESYCTAFGLLLAIVGTVSLLFLISVVCFLKGVG